MDILSVLSSVNIVALVFFILTLGFVIYEFSMYLSESGSEKAPQVPQFNPNAQAPNVVSPVAPPVQQIKSFSSSKKNRLLPLLIATFILIILGILAFFYAPSTKSVPKLTPTTAPKPSPTPVIQSLVPTSIPKPTAAAIVERTVEDVTIIPTSTPKPKATATITPTSMPIVAASENLPVAGSFQYLLLLSIAASAVIAVSLLF